MNTGLRKTLRKAMFRLRSHRLHEDAAVDIRAVGGHGNGLMIVFTSYHANAAKRGLLEFSRSASARGARHCIFVTDRRQGWFEGDRVSSDIVQTVNAYVDQHAIDHIMTVGVSMGGYGAVSFAGDLRADRSLAFAPQYSPRPSRFPQDRRWLKARQRIGAFTRPDLASSMQARVRYTVLHGRRNRDDIHHWDSFPQGPNIQHYLLDSADHDVIDPLRRSKVLYPLIDAVWHDDQAGADNLMQSIGAQSRTPGERASPLSTSQAAETLATASLATH